MDLAKASVVQPRRRWRLRLPLAPPLGPRSNLAVAISAATSRFHNHRHSTHHAHCYHSDNTKKVLFYL